MTGPVERQRSRPAGRRASTTNSSRVSRARARLHLTRLGVNATAFTQRTASSGSSEDSRLQHQTAEKWGFFSEHAGQTIS